MLYLESPSTNPYFNLALEEHIFHTVGQSENCLIFWQNENTVVIGRYQNTIEEINSDVVKERNIRVVRRLSGGGAVYHDLGNLNYTIIVDQQQFPDFDFKLFTAPVIEALHRLDITAEFTGRNDLTIDGKKFSGNAQYIHNGRIMHHGCIMVETDVERVSEALQVRAAKFQSKSTKSVRSRVTTINANAPQPITVSAFKQTLLERIGNQNPLTPLHLSDEDLLAVRTLQQEKYETWEWNYGASPAFDMQREMKFPAALVSAHLSVSDGKIKAIRFYGDFFSSRDVSVLENQLVGIPINEHLEETLSQLPISEYMSGITAADLCRLLQ